jgi:hypothetical protein
MYRSIYKYSGKELESSLIRHALLGVEILNIKVVNLDL